MSTVKISQLPLITQIDANTSNTLFAGVDVQTNITGRMTAHTLAQSLYSNEILNVGVNPVTYSNVVGQFSGSSATYSQINNQNFNSNGSADYVASTSDSDNSTKYVDMGINGSTFSDPTYSSMKPYDSYLYSYGPATNSFQGNLVIGTASSDANIVFIAGGTTSSNIVAKIGKKGLTLLDSTHITFNDGSIQTVAAAPADYTSAAFLLANTTTTNINHLLGSMDSANASIAYQSGVDVSQNTAITNIQGVNTTQNTNIDYITGVNTSQNAYTSAAFSKANNALANTTGTFAGDLTITGNTFAQKVNAANSIVANNAVIDGITISNNSIYSTQSSVDISIGQTTATANLVVNRTANFAKDIYVTGNTNSTGFVYGSAAAVAMVTQLVSKANTVYASGTSGQITMHNATLNGGTSVTFTVNNSYVQHVSDIPIVAIQSSVFANLYVASIANVRVGSFDIILSNTGSGGPSNRGDAVILNWALLRVGS